MPRERILKKRTNLIEEICEKNIDAYMYSLDTSDRTDTYDIRTCIPKYLIILYNAKKNKRFETARSYLFILGNLHYCSTSQMSGKENKEQNENITGLLKKALSLELIR